MPATIFPCSPAVINPNCSCKLTSPDILSHQAKDTSFFISGSEGADLAHINLKSVLIGMLFFLCSPIVLSLLCFLVSVFSPGTHVLGNGLTDGKTQYSQYANMACNNSYGPVLSDSDCAAMDEAYPRCAQLIQSCYDNQ
jgi:hypothetical protein